MTFDALLPWVITGLAVLLAVLSWARRGDPEARGALRRLSEDLERDALSRQHDMMREAQSRQDDLRHLHDHIERGRLDTLDRLAQQTERQVADQGEARIALLHGLRDMAADNARQLALIREAVQEQLHTAVEKQMQTSFQRVLEQFAQMQKALGEVTAVTAQIGDLKRLFSNVKARGGWGEAQLRAVLDDVLPEGAYDRNFRVGDGGEVVEFAVVMPVRGALRPRLAIDSKFPTEAYERLLEAAQHGDVEAERVQRRALETQVRQEARKIAEKYIRPPITVEFAVLYLPTDGLYAEIARSPGLIDEIGRLSRVIVMGPSLIPALLRTVHLGYVTLALEDRTETIARLLGLTRQEMLRMDGVLEKLSRQTGTISTTIEDARRRTRVLGRRLASLDPDDSGEPAPPDMPMATGGVLDRAPDPAAASVTDWAGGDHGVV